MAKIIYVNRYNSSVLSLNFLSRVLGTIILVFLSIFFLGPAVFFIINGVFCTILFFRPYSRILYQVYKFLFKLKDYEFYMQEVPLNFGFWIKRGLLAIIALGQIGIGIYFLIRYGFLEQNLIHAILQQ
jgi:hypothetical protein